jgi:hypothetical protein
MKNLLIKAITILSILVASNMAEAYDVSFEGNFVIVTIGRKTYFVDVTEALKKGDANAIVQTVCDKIPQTCRPQPR